MLWVKKMYAMLCINQKHLNMDSFQIRLNFILNFGTTILFGVNDVAVGPSHCSKPKPIGLLFSSSIHAFVELFFFFKVRKEWKTLIERDNCHPAKTVILALVQIPLWVILSTTFRNIVYKLPHNDACKLKIML